jgi:hypothetical protein
VVGCGAGKAEAEMNDPASEAVLVAVSAFLVWFLVVGGFDFPDKFNLRRLFVWTTVIALVLGAIAVLARIQH